MVRRFHRMKIGVCGAVLLCLAAKASAITINVDFNETGSPTGTYMGLGAAPDLGTSWNGVNTGVFPSNNATLTSSALTASDGHTATPVTVTIGNYGVFDASNEGLRPAGFANALLGDYVYDVNSAVADFPSGLSPVTFSINNVPAGAYDLYVYSQNGGYYSVDAKFFVNGATIATQTLANSSGDSTAFVLGSNYLVFTGLTGGGTISGSFVTNQVNNFGAFDGFQLVSVPEPSTLVLLGAGALAGIVVAGLRRRRGVAA